MAGEIRISRKKGPRGADEYKIVSVRMKESMLDRLEELATATNRSRNELINLLIASALELVKIDE